MERANYRVDEKPTDLQAAEGDNAFMGGYIREAVKVAKDESDPDL